MRIGLDKAAQIIQLLCEGMSVRGTCRITGVSKGTVLDLLLHVGPKCDEYMQQHIQDVHVDNVQVDEIWQYVFCKAPLRSAKSMSVAVAILTPSPRLSAPAS